MRTPITSRSSSPGCGSTEPKRPGPLRPRCRAAPRITGLYTSISSAIDFAAGLFARSGFEGTRRIVDISGDGADNAVRPTRSLARARDDALDRGLILNGLAILDADPPKGAPWPARRAPPLDEYYRDAVIGGPGPLFWWWRRGFEAFGPALRRKLAREIAQAAPPPQAEPRIERVSA